MNHEVHQEHKVMRDRLVCLVYNLYFVALVFFVVFFPTSRNRIRTDKRC